MNRIFPHCRADLLTELCTPQGMFATSVAENFSQVGDTITWHLALGIDGYSCGIAITVSLRRILPSRDSAPPRSPTDPESGAGNGRGRGILGMAMAVTRNVRPDPHRVEIPLFANPLASTGRVRWKSRLAGRLCAAVRRCVGLAGRTRFFSGWQSVGCSTFFGAGLGTQIRAGSRGTP
jgi:hypothetical protein